MYIVKEPSGDVVLYYKKPRYKNGHWLSVDGKYFTIDPKLVPKIKKNEAIEISFNI